MHLKSLTLKGFKSFASSTTLRFEPGITAVVGPNGSGKSNVVDAIAWVLGEQGAKALRGGKMNDVIFAGTAGRPPLGRAEVTLTIDNRDGALPIDYDEVSITRRMFRDGAGEYEINGKACRLLDIQDLLSDSGIGREMHVIVSQGHLDAVLSARPEDRRAFIEEAAGVLKHRKRKEKALRKLDAMQANLARLGDLTTELRRQLGPLGRQAEIARRAASIQVDLRDARLRLLADDYAALANELHHDAAAEEAAIAERSATQQQLAAANTRLDAASAQLAAATPALAAASATHMDLLTLAERIRGVSNVAEERARNLSVPRPARAGRKPEELLAAAEEAAAQQIAKDNDVAAAKTELHDAIAMRVAQEEQLQRLDQELHQVAQQLADQREGRARLAGQLAAAEDRLVAYREEDEQLALSLAAARQQVAAAEAEFAELRSSISALDSSETDLDAVYQRAASEAQAAHDELATITATRTAAHSEIANLSARLEALQLGLVQRSSGADIAAATSDIAGIQGPIARYLSISPGAEKAIAAALGTAAEALGAVDTAAGFAAIDAVIEQQAGRATVIVAEPHGKPPDDNSTVLPPEAEWALSLVQVKAPFTAVLTSLLADTVITADIAQAQSVVESHPNLTAVTRDGTMVRAGWISGGNTAGQSGLELQATITRCEQDLARVQLQAAAVDETWHTAQQLTEQKEAAAARALDQLHESDARIAAVSEQLAQLGAAVRTAHADVTRVDDRRARLRTARENTQHDVDRLLEQLAIAETQQAPASVDAHARDEVAAALTIARHEEVEARLRLRTAEERAAATANTAQRLRKAAQEEQRAAQRSAELARIQERSSALAAQVAELGTETVSYVERSLAKAAAELAAAETERARLEVVVTESRQQVADLQLKWDALTDSVHSTEVLRAQQRLRLEQLAQTAAEEFGITPEVLLTEYGPEVLVPPPAAEIAEYEAAKAAGDIVNAPIAMPYDRVSTERRAKRAAKDMATLGRVNPLALEEFAAMEERYAFLAKQLEDLQQTRTDLLAVIAEVDEKILHLFTEAYYDVAAQFVKVFATLFPGGEGELYLTNPDDMLTTGIDVVARPPGKKVRRLSLLSGGERSLVAVAMLVAIFRARPSPFYVLDEVEAALDEVNLSRLVGLLRELRHSSQLLVITHQKYTMEAADVLYGVSMRGDGISQVISQRLQPANPGSADSDNGGDDAHATPATPVNVGDGD